MKNSENEGYVYKITRNDGQIYIGITVDPEKRLKAHLKTERFSIGIKEFELLHSNISYEEAGQLEEYYIEYFDSFHNGLNESISGKGNHLAPNFTTKGFKFSRESRIKMSESAKRSNHAKHNLPEITPEYRRKLSEKRRGICWKKRIITNEMAIDIIDSYENKTIEFTDEFIRSKVSKKYKKMVGRVPLEELATPNGKRLTYRMLIIYHYSAIYNVTGSCISAILKTGKSYAKTTIHHSER